MKHAFHGCKMVRTYICLCIFFFVYYQIMNYEINDIMILLNIFYN